MAIFCIDTQKSTYFPVVFAADNAADATRL